MILTCDFLVMNLCSTLSVTMTCLELSKRTVVNLKLTCFINQRFVKCQLYFCGESSPVRWTFMRNSTQPCSREWRMVCWRPSRRNRFLQCGKRFVMLWLSCLGVFLVSYSVQFKHALQRPVAHFWLSQKHFRSKNRWKIIQIQI